jgi:hypothetical protein
VVFSYGPHQIDALEATISRDRLARHVSDAAGDRTGALQLYVFNTTASEAFYTPLQGLEICLRNAIGSQLLRAFGITWIHRGKMPMLQYPLTDMLANAEAGLRDDNKPVTHGSVIAELSFGFWVTILSGRYEMPLWRPLLRHAFPLRPKGIERKQIHGALNAVRRLRNRIAHHEPILTRDLGKDHNTIVRLVSWMCADTADWVAAHSRLPQVLATGPSINPISTLPP